MYRKVSIYASFYLCRKLGSERIQRGNLLEPAPEVRITISTRILVASDPVHSRSLRTPHHPRSLAQRTCLSEYGNKRNICIGKRWKSFIGRKQIEGPFKVAQHNSFEVCHGCYAPRPHGFCFFPDINHEYMTREFSNSIEKRAPINDYDWLLESRCIVIKVGALQNLCPGNASRAQY